MTAPATTIRTSGTPVELAAAGDGPKRFRATAYSGAPIKLGGYAKPVVIDVAGVQIPAGGNVPCLRQHDHERPVGHATIAKTAGTIEAAGVLSGVGPAVDEIVAMSRNGFPWQISVGGDAGKTEVIGEGQSVKVNGRTVPGPVTVVRAMSLREISFVPIGADADTSATIAAGGKAMNEFSVWVSAQGFDESVLTDLQRQSLRATFDAEQQRLEAAARQEIEAAAGDKLLLRYLAEAGEPGPHNSAPARIQSAYDTARASGLTGSRLEVELMRAARPNAPHVYVPNRPAVTNDVLAAAAMISHGQAESTVGKVFNDDRVMNAAVSKQYRGLTLHGIFRQVLAAHGRHAPPGRLQADDLREGMRISAAGGPSVLSVSNILANVANKSALAAFSGVPTTWGKWCRVSSVPDFKTSYSYRLTGSGALTAVPPGGEVQHASLTDAAHSNSILQYGKLIGIDRTQLINDDLGMLTSTPAILGRMAAVSVEKCAYTKLLTNTLGGSDFFSTAHANYDTGAGYSLSAAGLASGYKKFMEQVDEAGDPTMIMPQVLLVSPKNWETARILLTSDGMVGSTTADTLRPSANPWINMFELVAGPFLAESAALSGSDDDRWYLLAGPGDYAVMDMAFLNGQQSPTVESFDMDVNRLGIVARVVYDFGCEFLEYRGGYASEGD